MLRQYACGTASHSHPLDRQFALRTERTGALPVKQFRYGLFVVALAAIGAGAGAAARANTDFATLIASIPSELPASIPAIALPDPETQPPAALLEA
ncbi:MAG: hypothetical protein AAFY15_03175, partial [Cyanobacteria bacterium J06648_11]